MYARENCVNDICKVGGEQRHGRADKPSSPAGDGVPGGALKASHPPRTPAPAAIAHAGSSMTNCTWSLVFIVSR